jgi:hypothetical protein
MTCDTPTQEYCSHLLRVNVRILTISVMLLKQFQKCVEGNWVCTSEVVENSVQVAGKNETSKEILKILIGFPFSVFGQQTQYRILWTIRRP